MENIEKYFPGVHALDNCKFDINAGEVHALIGENGAGKSTLMKILTGIYPKDSGEIYVKGSPVNISGPSEAQALGIGIIHQELNLMQHLTVAENIFIGREPMNGLFINTKKMNDETDKLLNSLSLSIKSTDKVEDLSVAKQQMVEIAKALSLNSETLIMDEPSAALTESEITELFKFINKLRDDGHGIVYISHRMEELFIISDRITVMRDGKYINTLNTKETDVSEIIQLMVGRVIYEEPKSKSTAPPGAPVILEVKGLKSPLVKDVSFELHQGEILGFAGLMGAGRTETARLIFGADPMDSGEIFVNGQKINIKTPRDAVNNGIGYLSEDRKRYGLSVGLSVSDNITMADLENFTKNGFIDSKKEASTSKEYINKLSIKTPSISQLIKFLSGGNQQKVVIAKWLVKNCNVLIFDEPTRGIDVGAKSEIYKLMAELTKEGKSIIMISSEMPEILRMSDRIAVMCEGRMTGILKIEEATQELIMKYATSRK
jgi:ribose transport system ATP-binding protein